jgi:ferredoxin
MIQITDKSKCCGCNACGLCNKVCPIEHSTELKTNDLQQSICYATEHKNLEVVFDSTSGGFFLLWQKLFIRVGGAVGGAVFNDDFSVKHFISNDKADLVRRLHSCPQ